MRRFFLSITCLSLLALSGCKNDDVTPDLLEVKVLEQVCGSAVLQVVSGTARVPLGTYTDIDGVVHQKAFGTFLDPCADNYPPNLSETFFVRIIDEEERSNCIVCLALPANMPDENYPIRIIDPEEDR